MDREKMLSEIYAQIDEVAKNFDFSDTSAEQIKELIDERLLVKWQKRNEELWKKFTDKFVKVQAGLYGTVNVTLPTKFALDNWQYFAEHDEVKILEANKL